MIRSLLAALFALSLIGAGEAITNKGFLLLEPHAAITTIFSKNLPTGNGWDGYSIRVVIPSTNIVAASGGHISVSIVSIAGSSGAGLTGAYIGNQASSGNAYNFDGGQVRLTFGGSGTITGVTGANTYVSDFVPFRYTAGKALVFAIDVSVSGNWEAGENTSVPESLYYLSSVTDASQTAPSGTWTGPSGECDFITLIRVTP
jgi:hypothetical protein